MYNFAAVLALLYLVLPHVKADHDRHQDVCIGNSASLFADPTTLKQCKDGSYACWSEVEPQLVLQDDGSEALPTQTDLLEWKHLSAPPAIPIREITVLRCASGSISPFCDVSVVDATSFVRQDHLELRLQFSSETLAPEINSQEDLLRYFMLTGTTWGPFLSATWQSPSVLIVQTGALFEYVPIEDDENVAEGDIVFLEPEPSEKVDGAMAKGKVDAKRGEKNKMKKVLLESSLSIRDKSLRMRKTAVHAIESPNGSALFSSLPPNSSSTSSAPFVFQPSKFRNITTESIFVPSEFPTPTTGTTVATLKPDTALGNILITKPGVYQVRLCHWNPIEDSAVIPDIPGITDTSVNGVQNLGVDETGRGKVRLLEKLLEYTRLMEEQQMKELHERYEETLTKAAPAFHFVPPTYSPYSGSVSASPPSLVGTLAHWPEEVPYPSRIRLPVKGKPPHRLLALPPVLDAPSANATTNASLPTGVAIPLYRCEEIAAVTLTAWHCDQEKPKELADFASRMREATQADGSGSDGILPPTKAPPSAASALPGSPAAPKQEPILPPTNIPPTVGSTEPPIPVDLPPLPKVHIPGTAPLGTIGMQVPFRSLPKDETGSFTLSFWAWIFADSGQDPTTGSTLSKTPPPPPAEGKNSHSGDDETLDDADISAQEGGNSTSTTTSDRFSAKYHHLRDQFESRSAQPSTHTPYTATHRVLFFKGKGGNDQRRTPSAWLDAKTNHLLLRVSSNETYDVGATSLQPLPTQQWVHLAFVFRNVTGEHDLTIKKRSVGYFRWKHKCLAKDIGELYKSTLTAVGQTLNGTSVVIPEEDWATFTHVDIDTISCPSLRRILPHYKEIKAATTSEQVTALLAPHLLELDTSFREHFDIESPAPPTPSKSFEYNLYQNGLLNTGLSFSANTVIERNNGPLFFGKDAQFPGTTLLASNLRIYDTAITAEQALGEYLQWAPLYAPNIARQFTRPVQYIPTVVQNNATLTSTAERQEPTIHPTTPRELAAQLYQLRTRHEVNIPWLYQLWGLQLVLPLFMHGASWHMHPNAKETYQRAVLLTDALNGEQRESILACPFSILKHAAGARMESELPTGEIWQRCQSSLEREMWSALLSRVQLEYDAVHDEVVVASSLALAVPGSGGGFDGSRLRQDASEGDFAEPVGTASDMFSEAKKYPVGSNEWLALMELQLEEIQKYLSDCSQPFILEDEDLVCDASSAPTAVGDDTLDVGHNDVHATAEALAEEIVTAVRDALTNQTDIEIPAIPSTQERMHMHHQHSPRHQQCKRPLDYPAAIERLHLACRDGSGHLPSCQLLAEKLTLPGRRTCKTEMQSQSKHWKDSLAKEFKQLQQQMGRRMRMVSNDASTTVPKGGVMSQDNHDQQQYKEADGALNERHQRVLNWYQSYIATSSAMGEENQSMLHTVLHTLSKSAASMTLSIYNFLEYCLLYGDRFVSFVSRNILWMSHTQTVYPIDTSTANTKDTTTTVPDVDSSAPESTASTPMAPPAPAFHPFRRSLMLAHALHIPLALSGSKESMFALAQHTLLGLTPPPTAISGTTTAASAENAFAYGLLHLSAALGHTGAQYMLARGYDTGEGGLLTWGLSAGSDGVFQTRTRALDRIKQDAASSMLHLVAHGLLDNAVLSLHTLRKPASVGSGASATFASKSSTATPSTAPWFTPIDRIFGPNSLHRSFPEDQWLTSYLYEASSDATHQYIHAPGQQPLYTWEPLTPETADTGAAAVGQKGEDDQLLRYQELRAEEGHIPSMEAMAELLYFGGRGYARDHVAARGYWNRAAEAGSVKAMLGAAAMYAKGEGGDRNLTKAEELFEEALEKSNSTRALTGLGFVHHVRGNDTAACDYFWRAAQRKEDGDTLLNSARCWEQGLGTGKTNYTRSVELLAQGVDLGHLSSYYALGKVFSTGAVPIVQRHGNAQVAGNSTGAPIGTGDDDNANSEDAERSTDQFQRSEAGDKDSASKNTSTEPGSKKKKRTKKQKKKKIRAAAGAEGGDTNQFGGQAHAVGTAAAMPGGEIGGEVGDNHANQGDGWMQNNDMDNVPANGQWHPAQPREFQGGQGPMQADNQGGSGSTVVRAIAEEDEKEDNVPVTDTPAKEDGEEYADEGETIGAEEASETGFTEEDEDASDGNASTDATTSPDDPTEPNTPWIEYFERKRRIPEAIKYFRTFSTFGPWSNLGIQAFEAFTSQDYETALLLYLQASLYGYDVAQSNAAYLLHRRHTHIEHFFSPLAVDSVAPSADAATLDTASTQSTPLEFYTPYVSEYLSAVWSQYFYQTVTVRSKVFQSEALSKSPADVTVSAIVQYLQSLLTPLVTTGCGRKRTRKLSLPIELRTDPYLAFSLTQHHNFPASTIKFLLLGQFYEYGIWGTRSSREEMPASSNFMQVYPMPKYAGVGVQSTDVPPSYCISPSPSPSTYGATSLGIFREVLSKFSLEATTADLDESSSASGDSTWQRFYDQVQAFLYAAASIACPYAQPSTQDGWILPPNLEKAVHYYRLAEKRTLAAAHGDGQTAATAPGSIRFQPKDIERVAIAASLARVRLRQLYTSAQTQGLWQRVMHNARSLWRWAVKQSHNNDVLNGILGLVGMCAVYVYLSHRNRLREREIGPFVIPEVAAAAVEAPLFARGGETLEERHDRVDRVDIVDTEEPVDDAAETASEAEEDPFPGHVDAASAGSVGPDMDKGESETDANEKNEASDDTQVDSACSHNDAGTSSEPHMDCETSILSANPNREDTCNRASQESEHPVEVDASSERREQTSGENV